MKIQYDEEGWRSTSCGVPVLKSEDDVTYNSAMELWQHQLIDESKEQILLCHDDYVESQTTLPFNDYYFDWKAKRGTP